MDAYDADRNTNDQYAASGETYNDPNFDDTANIYDDDVIDSAPHPDYYGEHGEEDYPPEDGYPLDYDAGYPDDGYPVSDVPGQIGMYADADPYLDALDDDDEDVYLDSHDIHNRARNTTEIPSSDPKDGQREFWMRNCIFCCVCLSLLIGIIALAVRINQISDEEARAKTPHFNQVTLRPSPSDLSTKCTNEKVNTEQGFFECEELCEAADCCNYPTSLALSCLRGNNDECLEYHEHCSVLQLESGVIPDAPDTPTVVPKAPADIKSICSDASLQTVVGFEACVDDCMKAPCCWKKGVSLHVCTSDPNCDAYAPCLSMDASDQKGPGIKEEIKQKCADDNLLNEVGRNECIFACSHAACCFDPTASCPHENSDFCSQYAPCGHIYDDQGSVIEGGGASAANEIPTAPQFLETACTRSSLNTLPGYEMCTGACGEAECCWKETASCSGDAACEPYKTHCVHLDDLNDNTGSVTGSQQQIPAAPEYLTAACSDVSLESEAGFQFCKDTCMQAECCWKVSTCSSKPQCGDYASNCGKLVARLEGNGGGGGSESGSTSAPTQTISHPDTGEKVTLEKVYDACYNHDDVGSGESLCEIVCEPGSCCKEDPSSCPSAIDCSLYQACGVLKPGNAAEAAKVEEACSKDDRSDCVRICSEATCCFTSDVFKLCSTTNPTLVCENYKACEILYAAQTNANNP